MNRPCGSCRKACEGGSASRRRETRFQTVNSRGIFLNLAPPVGMIEPGLSVFRAHLCPHPIPRGQPSSRIRSGTFPPRPQTADRPSRKRSASRTEAFPVPVSCKVESLPVPRGHRVYFRSCRMATPVSTPVRLPWPGCAETVEPLPHPVAPHFSRSHGTDARIGLERVSGSHPGQR